jgi:nucleoside-diphosphate-sugar epimerase
MKVLLTGAAGFLGQKIAQSLLQQGVTDLRLHVRRQPPTGLLEKLRADYPNANIDWAAANLLAQGSLGPMLEGVDCLIHAAAGMRGAAADMFANTVQGSRNLLEAVEEHCVKRVVLISSFSVYRTIDLAVNAVHDERLPIEAVGIDKGAYAYAKTRQEQLMQSWREKCAKNASTNEDGYTGFELVILRPGVIYGPGGGAFSSRVGLRAMGFFFNLGGPALLPLTYVDNCADAVAVAALKAPDGAAFNVVDDDLPTCTEYLSQYRKEVERLRVLRLPYKLFEWSSGWLQRYHRKSKGQLPAVFTPYVVGSMYRPLKYSNAALKGIGWVPRVRTSEGLGNTFAWLKEQVVVKKG